MEARSRKLSNINIIQAIQDRALFGQFIKDQSTWTNWKIVLKSFFGLPLISEEFRVFQELTNRTESPKDRCDELWLIIGRRGGKSFIAALLGVFLAIFQDFSEVITSGETLLLPIVAPTMKQARIIRKYCYAFLTENKLLNSYFIKMVGGEIHLKNNVVIDILPANQFSTRGPSYVAVILDEIAFFSSEGAIPDQEILRALKPGLMTTGGPVIGISSPYSKRGVLYSVFQKHYSQNSPILVVQAASKTMNPTLSDKVLNKAREEDYEGSKSEIDAEFRSDITSFLDPERISSCIGDYVEIPYTPGKVYVAFCDSSGGRRDSYVVAIGHSDRGRIIIDAIRIRKPSFNPLEVTKQMAEFIKGYGLTKITGDFYAAQFLVEAWANCGIEYETSPVRSSDHFLNFEGQINTQNILIKTYEMNLKT